MPAGAGARRRRERTARRRPGFLRTAFASLAVFMVLFEFLRSSCGPARTPALGAGPITASAPAKPRPVLNRRIVKTRVVRLPARTQTTSGGTTVRRPGDRERPGQLRARPGGPGPGRGPAPPPPPPPRLRWRRAHHELRRHQLPRHGLRRPPDRLRPPPGAAEASAMVEECRRFIADFNARLSRFRPDSELCALNSDPRGRYGLAAPARRGPQRHRRRAGERRPRRPDAARRARGRRLPLVAGRSRAASLRDALLLARPGVRRVRAPVPAGVRSRSTRPSGPSAALRPALRHPAGPARAWPRTCSPSASAATPGSSSIAAATCGSAATRWPAIQSRSTWRTRHQGTRHVILVEGGAVATSGIDVRVFGSGRPLLPPP